MNFIYILIGSSRQNATTLHDDKKPKDKVGSNSKNEKQ